MQFVFCFSICLAIDQLWTFLRPLGVVIYDVVSINVGNNRSTCTSFYAKYLPHPCVRIMTMAQIHTQDVRALTYRTLRTQSRQHKHVSILRRFLTSFLSFPTSHCRCHRIGQTNTVVVHRLTIGEWEEERKKNSAKKRQRKRWEGREGKQKEKKVVIASTSTEATNQRGRDKGWRACAMTEEGVWVSSWRSHSQKAKEIMGAWYHHNQAIPMGNTETQPYHAYVSVCALPALNVVAAFSRSTLISLAACSETRQISHPPLSLTMPSLVICTILFCCLSARNLIFSFFSLFPRSANTVEDRILALQERKRQLADAVIDDGVLAIKRLTLADLRMLFGSR